MLSQIDFGNFGRTCKQLCYYCDLDHDSKIIIINSILTTFKESSIFKAAGAEAKISSTSKSKHRKEM